MKKKFLTAALLASATHLAVADTRSPAQFMPRPDYQGRFERMRWQPLSAMMTADYWFGRETIRLADDRDEISALRLVNGDGATYVYSLNLRYSDGHVETIPVNKWLYQGEQRMNFRLKPSCELKQITVDTFSWGFGTFQVFGERSLVARPPIGQQPPPPPPAPAPGPVSVLIGNNLTFANTNGYVYLGVGAQKGLFSKLRIESADSNTYIGAIHITFDSGAHQSIEVNKALSRGQVLDLDLTGTRSAITALELMDGVAHSTGRFSVSLVR